MGKDDVPDPDFYGTSDAANEGAARGAPAQPDRVGLGALDVLARWREEGPLLHESTGFPTLDRLTEGGPVYGTRWYLIGAPDAGKTAILLQWIADWAARGIVVGVLAVDEEPGDLVTRLAQRLGYSRHDCERRAEDTMDRLCEEISALAKFIRFYDGEFTIEGAAADLAGYASTLQDWAGGLAFVVDSIQTVRCDAIKSAKKELGPREEVTSNVRALRVVGTRYRAICVGTSEMNRNAYRDIDASEKSNDLAAAAESRAVEFSGRVLLSLRSVAGDGELAEVRLPKNKHGRSYPAWDEARFYLRIDRARQMLTEADAPAVEQVSKDDTEGVRKDAAFVAAMVATHQGIGVNALKDHMRAKYGSFSDPRVGAARAALGDALLEAPGKQRAKFLYLDGSKLGPIEALIPIADRPATLAATHPTQAGKAPEAPKRRRKPGRCPPRHSRHVGETSKGRVI